MCFSDDFFPVGQFVLSRPRMRSDERHPKMVEIGVQRSGRPHQGDVSPRTGFSGSSVSSCASGFEGLIWAGKGRVRVSCGVQVHVESVRVPPEVAGSGVVVPGQTVRVGYRGLFYWSGSVHLASASGEDAVTFHLAELAGSSPSGFGLGRLSDFLV